MPFVSPESFAKQTIASIQDYSILCWRAISNLFSRPVYWADIYTQMDSIGVGSTPIIVLTGFFTGCVLALQSATSLQEFGSVNLTGNLVALSWSKSSARCSLALWSPDATPPVWPPRSVP